MKIYNEIKPNAKVAILTNMPTPEDEVSGKLFSDKPAQKFLGILAANGIFANQITKLSLSQTRIPKGRYFTKKQHILHREYLTRQLLIAKPTIVVTLGEDPLRAMTGYLEHNKYRGSVLPSNIADTKVLSMYHPSVLNSMVESEPIFHWDCQKLRRHYKTKDLLCKDMKIHISRDMSLFLNTFLDEDYQNDPKSLLSYDIESYQGQLTAIGFAKSIDEAYVMPLHDMAGIEFAHALKTISIILESPVRKVAQNGNFDALSLGYYYKICVRNFYWDTMLANHAMYSNLPKGLDFLASIYTDEPYWKDEGKEWNPNKIKDWHKFYIYNGKDAANTLEIALEQDELLDIRGTRHIFQQEMDLCYPFLAAELRGFNADLSKKEELEKANREELRKLCLILSVFTGGTLHEENLEETKLWDKKSLMSNMGLNVNSVPQIRDYLYKQMKLPKRVYKGKITTNEDALRSLIPFDPPMMLTIMKLRKLAKRDIYYNMKTDPKDGRIRTTIKPGGTQTGRTSSSKSITGTGFNLQNVEKAIRVFFTADPGKILIQADYQKAESWIVAYLARCEKMLAALRDDDFHSTNASNILGEHVTKAQYRKRQLGKRVSHGANYGMTGFLLQKVLLREDYIYSKRECQALLDMYFDCYPNLKGVYHPWVQEQLKRDRTITSAFGRKITFWDFWGTRLFNKAYAFYPQSTVGDLTNRAIINLYKHDEYPLEILLQVHDSIVMQIDEKYLCQDLMDTISDCMAIPLVVRNSDPFTIPIDLEIGHNWYNLKDWEKTT